MDWDFRYSFQVLLPFQKRESSTVLSQFVDLLNHYDKQECIPVGCVPPAAVAVCWGGDLPQCMLGYLPGCVPGDPPGQFPHNLPPGCVPGDPSVRSLNILPGCGPGDPPWTDRHM